MIPLGVLGSATPRAMQPVDLPVGLLFPLTYEAGNIDGHALTASRPEGANNTMAPTPEGGLFDGLNTRVIYSGLPSQLTARFGRKVICAETAGVSVPATTITGQYPIVTLAQGGGGWVLSLMVRPDYQRTGVPTYALRIEQGTLDLLRHGWTFQGLYPDRTVAGATAKPQAVEFLPDGRLLVSAHYNDALSRVHVLAPPGSGEQVVAGWFDFPSPYNHVASCSVRADGTVWFGDYATGTLLCVDLAASLATNAAVITASYDCTAIPGFGAVSWGTVAGTEYLFAGEYVSSSSASVPKLHVIPGTAVIDGGTFTPSAAHRVYDWMFRCQGIHFHGGSLLATTNRAPENMTALGGSQPIMGWVLRYGVDLSLPSGGNAIASWAQERSYYGPGRYLEDVTVRADGTVWTSTEGYVSTGDRDGWIALWSTADAGPLPEASHRFVIDYEGAETPGPAPIRVHVDGRQSGSFQTTPQGESSLLALGGHPGAGTSVGWNDWAYRGLLRNVLVSWQRPTDAQLAALWTGSFEPRVLASMPLSIQNPGAEDALNGWAVEVGGLVNRASSPPPHSGASYFSGGSVARSRSAQALSIAGVPTADIDAGKAHAVVRWWQAGSAGDGTPGDRAYCGLRARSVSNAVLAQNPEVLAVWVGNQEVWYQRSAHLPLPAGTRSLDVFIDTIRQAGTVLQGNIDDIESTVYWRG